MLEKVHTYTFDTTDIFEEVLKKDGYGLNHVVIEPGKVFPAHPTDANVTIIVVRGTLSLTLEQQRKASYVKGHIVEIDKGTLSTLGNTSTDVVEVFVIKSQRD